ncbi:MAG TPA: hypothetical protein DD379_24750 [Cyanobacteria bacterium UBA11162]|nr:hypothetical protein [Cyanobacteria bacterium UBA11162]
MPRKKGQPYVRDQLKTRINISVTPTAADGLKQLAADEGYSSVSDMIERLGRGEVALVRTDQSQPIREQDIVRIAPELSLISIGRLLQVFSHRLNKTYRRLLFEIGTALINGSGIVSVVENNDLEATIRRTSSGHSSD